VLHSHDSRKLGRTPVVSQLRFYSASCQQHRRVHSQRIVGVVVAKREHNVCTNNSVAGLLKHERHERRVPSMHTIDRV
jgi:hypothetical protein